MKHLSKDDIKIVCKTILHEARAMLELKLGILGKEGEESRARIAEHDPILAELCKKSATADIEPLKNIVKYLTTKMEN